MKRKPKNIPVIAYHSVGLVNNNWNRYFLTTHVNHFEDQLKFFKKNFQIISLSDYYEIRSKIRPMVSRPLVLTFDDGFLDNWVYAYPLLKKYGLKATVFICPEFVDSKAKVRPNTDDLNNGNVKFEELPIGGYLSWDELRIMDKSNVFDVQSHTMTHTKYFISDKLIGFHHSLSDSLYPIGNLYPEQKPLHIGDRPFQKLIPNGYPFFEEASSVVAKKIEINPDFIDACVKRLSSFSFENYNFQNAFKIIEPLYATYKKEKQLIIRTESIDDYNLRLNHEIVESKNIIENELNKCVDFLCWPHGDNNQEAHEIALAAGYKLTTAGVCRVENDDITRIPRRLGVDISSYKKKVNFIIKLKALKEDFPVTQLVKFVRYIKKVVKNTITI